MFLEFVFVGFQIGFVSPQVVLARPPGAMVPESSIVLHFRPALAPLPVSDNLELVF